jgi:predicted metal-dependent hydrolase
MNKTEIIENFQIKYKKHPFSKNIKISLKNERQILVTMPILCPYKFARDFLLKNFKKIKSFKFENKILSKDLKTKFDTLKIIESNEIKIIVKNNIVYFYYPNDVDFNSLVIQEALREAYLKAIKIEAKNYLPSRLEFLARKHGFNYCNVALRNQKTRFGSCSYQNNINLNINLMNYDFDCIDYVLIHELVHTKIKNHSSIFWQEVEKYCPNYKELRQRLKKAS